MITPGSVNPLLLASADNSTTPCGGSISTPSYVIKNSLRFRSSGSAYLTHTPRAVGNKLRRTWSVWVKRGKLGVDGNVFHISTGAFGDEISDYIKFTANDELILFVYNNSSGAYIRGAKTSKLFRDPSAFYHLVLTTEKDNPNGPDHYRIYVNGIRETSLAWNPQGATGEGDITGFQEVCEIGTYKARGEWFDGYLADFHFIDGQALDATSFGEFDSNNVWRPKAYSGGAMTGNSFWLKFDDAAQIGKDSSGLGNHWTANNIDVAAPGTQTTYDLMKDSPVMFDDGTPNPPGNYAVLNPLDSSGLSNSGITLSNGNLQVYGQAANSASYSSVGFRSGKYYFEYSCISQTGVMAAIGGILDINGTPKVVDNPNTIWVYAANGVNNSGALQSPSFSYAVNDIVGIAYDADTGRTIVSVNGVQKIDITLTSLVGKNCVFFVQNGTNTGVENFVVNFGQTPWRYTPPTNFRGLCSTTLPTPSITNGKQHFDIALGAGAGILAQAQALTPHDLIWIKDRANSNNHQLIDVVRGANALHSNDTNPESAYVAPSGNSVAWAWKAGGAAVNNTDGSIASQVSVNKCAGFSIVTYTGAGGAKTVGHGLGAKPNMIFVKDRLDGAAQWVVYHSDLGATKGMYLNGTGSAGASPAWWNNTEPTSTVFTVNTSTDVNVNTHSLVAYCWTAIPGMSAFGSYTGNGNADGVFCYLGFKPKFLMIKQSSGADSWVIEDTARDTYNVDMRYSAPDSNGPEWSATTLRDILSNGFKARSLAQNISGQTYIYAAFAETPFKISNAR